MYDEFDEDALLGAEALVSMHFEDDWGIDHADAVEHVEAMDESLADIRCAEELYRAHRMLLEA
jgi:hypothetical protein